MYIIDIVVQSYVSRICSTSRKKELEETATMTPGVRLCFKLTQDQCGSTPLRE